MPSPGYYAVTFTDKSVNQPLIVEPNTIDGPNHPCGVNFRNSDAIANTTPLVYFGKATASYGDGIADNFLNLLENFACPTPPTKPVAGQLWYKNGDSFPILSISISGAIEVEGDITALIAEKEALRTATNPETIDFITTFSVVNYNNNSENAISQLIPIQAVYNAGSNSTIIEFTGADLTTLASAATSYNLVVHSQSAVLFVYNGFTNAWEIPSSVLTQSTQPTNSTPGTLWLDTSTSPATLKYYRDAADGYSESIITEAGGTFSNPIHIPITPTDPTHAASKDYIDQAINALTGGSGSIDLSQLVTDVQTNTANITTNTADITLNTADILSNTGAISTLQTNVTDLQNDKLDLLGGTMAGDIIFEVPELGASANIHFATASSALNANQSVQMYVEGINTTSTFYTTLIGEAGANQGYVVQIEEDGIPYELINANKDNTTFGGDLYKGSISQANEIWTEGDVTSLLNTSGAVVNNATFNSTTFDLTLDTVNLSTGTVGGSVDVNLGSLAGIATYDFTPQDAFMESLHKTFPTASDVIQTTAIRMLDVDKVSEQYPRLQNVVDSRVRLPFDAVDTTNSITVVTASIQPGDIPTAYRQSTGSDTQLLPSVGDSVWLKDGGTEGFVELDFSAWPDKTPTWTDVATYPGSQVGCNIVIDGAREVPVVVNVSSAASLTSLALIATEIETQVNGVVGTPVISATYDGVNHLMRISSLSKGGLSSVNVGDDTLFPNIRPGEVPIITPQFGFDVGDENTEFHGIVTNMTFPGGGVIDIEVTTEDDLINAIVNELIFPTPAINNYNLVTKQYVDENAGVLLQFKEDREQSSWASPAPFEYNILQSIETDTTPGIIEFEYTLYVRFVGGNNTSDTFTVDLFAAETGNSAVISSGIHEYTVQEFTMGAAHTVTNDGILINTNTSVNQATDGSTSITTTQTLNTANLYQCIRGKGFINLTVSPDDPLHLKVIDSANTLTGTDHIMAGSFIKLKMRS